MPDETDKEIFDAAMSDTPAEQPEVVEQAEAPVEQPRDEHGKFVPKAEVEADKSTTATPAEKPLEQKPVEQPDHRIPLSEHLREREERQAAQRERDDLRRQMEALQRQLNESKQPKAEAPDPYADPQAFRDFGVKEAITPIERKMEDMRLGFSKTLAVEKFGAETVDAAFSAIEQAFQTNPQTSFEYQRIMASSHPYGELVAWHKRQSTLKEIGDDPVAYKTRLRGELLKDPEFLKQAMEAARTQAGGTNGTRPNVVTRLPPSLSRVTSAASNDDGEDTDPGDAAIFAAAARGQ